MEWNENNLLILAGIAAIIIEILLGAITGFELLIVGVIFIISGGIGLMFGSFSYALIAVLVLSLLYLLVARRFIKQRLSVATTNTNVDALIGKQGVVVKSITPDKPGQVKVEGEVWRAQSTKAHAVDTVVTISAVSGVTLIVN